MSLFSRFFRKAPTPSVPVPPPLSQEGPSEDARGVPTRQSVPDRSRAAASDEETLKVAIDGHDGPTIARLVIEGASTKVRQMAAHAVDDPVVLRQLIRDARGGKDKSVYKILTSKRDVLLEQERKLEQLHAEIGAVGAAIERHSQRTFDPLFTATLEQLETRWKGVAADAGPGVGQKVQEAIDRAREVIAQHLRQIAAPRRRAPLVGHHTQRLSVPRKFQDRQ